MKLTGSLLEEAICSAIWAASEYPKSHIKVIESLVAKAKGNIESSITRLLGLTEEDKEDVEVDPIQWSCVLVNNSNRCCSMLEAVEEKY